MDIISFLDMMNEKAMFYIPIVGLVFILLLILLFKKRREYISLEPVDENASKMEKLNKSDVRDAIIMAELLIFVILTIGLSNQFWLAIPEVLIILILIELGNLKLKMNLKEKNIDADKIIRENKNKKILEEQKYKKGSPLIVAGIVFVIMVLTAPLWGAAFILFLFSGMSG